MRQAQLTDLEPYTEYMVEVEARNEFTVVLPSQPHIFGPEVTFRTLEGGKPEYMIYTCDNII